MIENNVTPEIPEGFVPPFPLTTEEIKKQTKQEGENFVKASLTLKEEELRAAEENKGIIKSIVDPTPGLLVKMKWIFRTLIFRLTQQTSYNLKFKNT